MIQEINTSWHPLIDGNAQSWASGWGQDEYGVWQEFTIEIRIAGIKKLVTQKLRWIPAGKFSMGSPEDELGRYSGESPKHRVILKQGFWLFDTCVTQALWEAVMGENPSRFKSPDRPVEQVSWDDCQKFIEKINEVIPGLELGLPSEAQWEYACRANSTTAVYKIIGRNNIPVLDDIAWHFNNSEQDFKLDNDSKEIHRGTHPVALKSENSWGLYDMLGNVWEWTEDIWHDNYDNAPVNGSAWLEMATGIQEEDQTVRGRVLRGGSWDDVALYCRSACRGRLEPDARDDGIGFRCVRDQ